MHEHDERLLRATFEIAQKARRQGDHPFGALLADEHGRILLQAENTVVSANDVTGHAEINLLRQAAAQLEPEFLQHCTLYTSTEPCPMCAGAIFWAGVGRVVYGLSQAGLYRLVGDETDDVLHLPCRELFARGRKLIQVVGPLLENEARQVHEGFWR